MDELKNLEKLAKKILNKKTYKKIKSVKDKNERKEVLEFAILSNLEIAHLDIEQKIKEMEKQNKDVFFAMAKLHRLYPKIKLFKATFKKEDYKQFLKLHNEIKKELENV
jgi:hypothetical protein